MIQCPVPEQCTRLQVRTKTDVPGCRNYKFATTTSVLAVSKRPAYGGICYSEISISQSETAVVYGADGKSVQQMWAPTTSGATAWAHVIDGWAVGGKPTVGCASRSSSSSSSSFSSLSKSKSKSSTRSSASLGEESSTDGVSGSGGNTFISSGSRNKKKNKKGGGGIAGAVIGAVAGIIAIIYAVIAVLKRRRGPAYKAAPVEEVHEAGDGQRAAEMGEYNQGPQMGGTPVYQLKSGGVVAEMGATERVPELEEGRERRRE